MADNFHKMEMDFGSNFSPDMLEQIDARINNLAVFGNVVELFIPNALQTAAQLIGGGGPNDQGGFRGTPTDPMDWRTKPR